MQRSSALKGRSVAGVAVVRRKVTVQITKVQRPVDTAQHVIAQGMIIEVEGAEASFLRTASLTHHRDVLPQPIAINSAHGRRIDREAFQRNRSTAATRAAWSWPHAIAVSLRRFRLG